MSRDAPQLSPASPEIPQPTRISSFTRLGTELSFRPATCLPHLHFSLLGRQRITRKAQDPSHPYHHWLDSNARKFPAVSAEQETQPPLSTAALAVVLLHARFQNKVCLCRANAAFKGWGQPLSAEYSSCPSNAPCPLAEFGYTGLFLRSS